MNKNIKKTISFAIIFTTFSTLMPSTINILEQYAYAYSEYEINTLTITSGDSTAPIYNSVTHNKDYKIKNGDKIPTVIYSKISSNNTNIKLNTIETKAADVRVFVGKEQLKLNDIYGEINIAEGESKPIYIRLYDSKSASDNDYAIEYELIVEREVSNSDDNALDTESEDDTITLKDYDDVYLDRLVLFNNNDQINFNFDKAKPIFTINVDEDTPYITVKAVPEQQSYNLLINDKHIATSGDDKDKREISLDKGKNVIKIRIVDSFEHKQREYFLIVTRGKDNLKTSNTNINTNENKNSENTQTSGMKTSGNWQYKKSDGTLAIGWTCIGDEWYYFDSTGIMKTGWLQDASGKWYYLTESGTMAKNTIIDGYKISSDGTCIGK